MEEKAEYITIDKETANEIENKMPEESELYELADLFKVFGDTTRIKILYVLFENEMWTASAYWKSATLSGVTFT